MTVGEMTAKHFRSGVLTSVNEPKSEVRVAHEKKNIQFTGYGNEKMSSQYNMALPPKRCMRPSLSKLFFTIKFKDFGQKVEYIIISLRTVCVCESICSGYNF